MHNVARKLETIVLESLFCAATAIELCYTHENVNARLLADGSYSPLCFR